MRYFLLLPIPMALLPSGIIHATRASALVLRSGSFNGFLSGNSTAAIGAIALATVTTTADNDLGMAATTLVEAAG